jgi:hypothetical protein
LLEVLQVSEIFDTLLTVNEGCDELLGLELLLELLGVLAVLELLGVPELLAVPGLVLEDAEDAL